MAQLWQRISKPNIALNGREYRFETDACPDLDATVDDLLVTIERTASSVGMRPSKDRMTLDGRWCRVAVRMHSTAMRFEAGFEVYAAALTGPLVLTLLCLIMALKP